MKKRNKVPCYLLRTDIKQKMNKELQETPDSGIEFDDEFGDGDLELSEILDD